MIWTWQNLSSQISWQKASSKWEQCQLESQHFSWSWIVSNQGQEEKNASWPKMKKECQNDLDLEIHILLKRQIWKWNLKGRGFVDDQVMHIKITSLNKDKEFLNKCGSGHRKPVWYCCYDTKTKELVFCCHVHLYTLFLLFFDTFLTFFWQTDGPTNDRWRGK